MNFFITSNKITMPEEMRMAFDQILQQETAAQGPERQVEILFNTEPEQLSFQFKFPKK
jgi:hypothetical protein